MNYQEALAFLYPRTTTIKFGLDTTRVLLESLGHPEAVYPTIHVGGTNGKGSVSTLIAAALREAGWKVGLYTSPHLCSFRERIMVDGAPVSEDAVAMWTATLEPLIRAHGATFFEATTAMALADFAARGVEIAVLEVGLGGRLDSTNVVTPLVSGVTNVALDHQKYLGDTIEDIAREKAGIAKPDVPFVIGETDPRVADLLAREAHDRIRQADPGGTCDLVVVEPQIVWPGPLGLAGPHQRRNAAVARAMLSRLPERYRPSDEYVAAGFAGARAPGRFDRRGRWLFDVAHNPDGIAALVEALAADPPPGPVHALVSILGDKPWPEMLVALDQAIDVGILTLAPTAADRGWDTAWLSQWLARSDRPPQRAEWHLVPDFHEALHRVLQGAGTVLVTGSFYTVGDVMAELGMAPIEGR
ncbi:MAG: folylpolyglutamate synthase/dihydrofolate synthase family protein [Gemmatimonadales bacterium]